MTTESVIVFCCLVIFVMRVFPTGEASTTACASDADFTCGEARLEVGREARLEVGREARLTSIQGILEVQCH